MFGISVGVSWRWAFAGTGDQLRHPCHHMREEIRASAGHRFPGGLSSLLTAATAAGWKRAKAATAATAGARARRARGEASCCTSPAGREPAPAARERRAAAGGAPRPAPRATGDTARRGAQAIMDGMKRLGASDPTALQRRERLPPFPGGIDSVHAGHRHPGGARPFP